jgi:hypothetical protein
VQQIVTAARSMRRKYAHGAAVLNRHTAAILTDLLI